MRVRDRAAERVVQPGGAEHEATLRVLPFPECTFAAPHAGQPVERPVSGFRTRVQETELRACTHLNDMLRCLAEVPALVASL